MDESLGSASASAPSAIPKERLEPGLPGPALLVTLLALAATIFVFLLVLGLDRDVTPGESQAATLPGGLADSLGAPAARIFSAAGASLAFLGVALIGRRLFHSDAVGLLGGLLFALDPATLVAGQLALPDAPILGLALMGVALLLSPAIALQWTGAATVAGATLLQPILLLWSVPLLLLLLVRGHVYAAPEHLRVAVAKAVALPAVGAFAGILAGSPWSGMPDCLALAYGRALLLARVAAPDAGQALLHGPPTWFAGLGAVVLVTFVAAGSVLAGFRLHRATGRFQMRISSSLAPLLARMGWLFLLAIFAPPTLWLPLFALALAAGIDALAEDAPGFGLAVAAIALALSALVLVRSWSVVTGSATAADLEDLVSILPWSRVQGCT